MFCMNSFLRDLYCLYVSVTNTKAYATLITEHNLFCLCIVIFIFSFIDVISVNTAKVLIFVNSAKTIKI